jgi:hypothetical protein
VAVQALAIKVRRQKGMRRGTRMKFLLGWVRQEV